MHAPLPPGIPWGFVEAPVLGMVAFAHIGMPRLGRRRRLTRPQNRRAKRDSGKKPKPDKWCQFDWPELVLMAARRGISAEAIARIARAHWDRPDHAEQQIGGLIELHAALTVGPSRLRSPPHSASGAV